MKLYIVPHSHIDVEWYWTAQDVQDMMPQLFYDTTLPALQSDPGLRFAQDQTVLWDMMLQGAGEEQRKLILEKVKDGALEPVGGTYVQPEVQEPCGESYIRQIQIGQKWMQEHLGKRARCAWHTDVFGQVGQLPQIFHQAGFDSFAFMRDINEKDDPETFPTEFWLEGPDGSRILTHWFRISYVLCESSDPDHRLVVATIGGVKQEKEELQYVFRQLLDQNSLQHKTGLAMLPWGGDVYGLTLRSNEIKEKLIDAARQVGLSLAEEDIILSTPGAFFDALREKAALLPVRRSDLTPPQYRQDLRGTYISRVGLKQKNRQAEETLLSCEALCACAGVDFSEGEALWRDVLFGQFHDTIGGSCIDEAYLAAMERDDAAIRAAEEKTAALLGYAEGGRVLNVFNPTPFARDEFITLSAKTDCCVKTAAGKHLYTRYDPKAELLTIHVPPMGPYETVSLYAEDSEGVCGAAEPTCVENEFYRLRFDPVSGNPVSIWDKQAQRELLHGQGNVTVAMEEQDPDMEGALCLTGKVFTDETVPASYMSLWQTEQETCVRTCKEFKGFTLEKSVVLRQGKRAVEFTTKILDYPGSDLIVTASFPFAMKSPRSLCQTPFAVQTGREGLFCAQKWAGLQDGAYTAAIINRGACAYIKEENTLQLALLRAHSNFKEYAKYGTDRGLARFADSGTHTELAAERGDHSFSYTLVAGELTFAELDKEAACCNARPIAVWSHVPAGIASPIGAVEGPFVITSLTPADDGIKVRGYLAADESSVCTLTLTKPVTHAQVVNLLEEPMGAASVEDGCIRLELRPFEIVTLLIKL